MEAIYKEIFEKEGELSIKHVSLDTNEYISLIELRIVKYKNIYETTLKATYKEDKYEVALSGIHYDIYESHIRCLKYLKYFR